MDRDDYDDYEEDFDDYDYDDAADDWEAEAAQEEEDLKAEEARRAALAEKKLGTRVPIKKEGELEEEEVLPDDVRREVDAMRQIASDIAGGEGIVRDSSVGLLADKPVATKEEAAQLGEEIAEHILTFSDSSNFKTMMEHLLEGLGREFSTIKCINELTAKITVATEDFKRRQKDQKKKKDVSIKQRDQLDFGSVEDKGGAITEVDETPW